MATKNMENQKDKEKQGNKGKKLLLCSDKKAKDLNTSNAYNLHRLVVAMPTTRFKEGFNV
jgi:hypothetical protein